MPRIPGLLERLQQPLYDTVTIEPHKTKYEFFQKAYTTNSILETSLFDYEALKEADGQAVQCPLCREQLIDGFDYITASVMTAIHQCSGCSTFYHRNCAHELGGCSTMGCTKKRHPIPPPIDKKGKSRFETNMTMGGYIPYPKNFEIHAISLEWDKTADQYDIDLFKQHGFFELRIGSKIYLELPIPILDKVSESFRGSYILAEPIDLIPQNSFVVTIDYHGPKKINAPFQLICTLHGFYKREVH